MFGLSRKEKVNMTRRIWVAGTFAVMLGVNALAGSTTLLGGHDTAAVSDKNPNLFAPAGFTFAIWGVIYLLLAGEWTMEKPLRALWRAKVWVVCHVVPETFDFSVGPDAEDMKFIDPSELEGLEDAQARYAIHYHGRHQARQR